MKDNKISVLLMAENRLVREALGRILDRASDIRVVASRGPDSTAFHQISAHAVDVLVLHPGGLALGDLKFVPLILDERPDVKVVAIGSFADDGVFLRNLRSRGVGYVLQDPSVSEVVNAVRAAVCRGEDRTCVAPKPIPKSTIHSAPRNGFESLAVAIGGPIGESEFRVGSVRLFAMASETCTSEEEQP
jgi:DNA-binding NarL/FixJ family response regulator